jgi:CspA family cold shock protein
MGQTERQGCSWISQINNPLQNPEFLNIMRAPPREDSYGNIGQSSGPADGRLDGVRQQSARTLHVRGRAFSLCRIATERLIERRGERSCFVKEKGTVKWFNGAKGYGFIQLTTGEDVFVHFSAIQENGYRTLNEGETVEFELLKGPKGFSAANVLRGAAN